MKKSLLAALLLLVASSFLWIDELTAQTIDEPAIQEKQAELSEGDIIRTVALHRRDNFIISWDMEELTTIPLHKLSEKIKSASQLPALPQVLPNAAELDFFENLQNATAMENAEGETLPEMVDNPIRHLQFSGFFQKDRKSSFIILAETRQPLPATELGAILNNAAKNDPEIQVAAKMQNSLPVFQITSEKFQDPLSVARLSNPNFLVLGTAKEVTKLLDDLAAGLDTSTSKTLPALLAAAKSDKYPITIAYSFDDKTHRTINQSIEEYGMKDSEVDNIMAVSSGLVAKLDFNDQKESKIYLALVFPKAQQAAMAKTVIYDGMVMGMMRFALMQLTGDQPLPFFDSMQSQALDTAAILTFTFTEADAEVMKGLSNALPQITGQNFSGAWEE